MVVEGCSFTTERLVVADWHEVDEDSLAATVAGLLSPAVTRSLPPDWGGAYDVARAGPWIRERDAEGTTLLAREAGAAVGLLLLHEAPGPGGVIVRVGYLVGEHAWGRGLGAELVEGLVGWCRGQAAVRSIVAGVAHDNVASIRILERSGFIAVAGTQASDKEREYRLDL